MIPRPLPQPLIALSLAVLAACSGGPSDSAAGSAGLTDALPLPTVDDAAWLGAVEGCEGRLAGEEDFAITRRDALVVASRGGTVQCVDTLEAITIELEAIGKTRVADEVYGGFVAAVQIAQVEDWATPTSGHYGLGLGRRGAEPSPQPNLGADVPTGDPAMDPSPQPNEPPQGEPSPQPNQPTTVSVPPPVVNPV